MEKLVIRLGETKSANVHWLLWSDTESEIIASGELDSSEQLPTLIERTGKESAIVVVPGSAVSLKTVNLPAKANRKVLAAVPYMLEDDVLGDIDQQFFVMAEKNGDEQQVLIVAHAHMQEWLNCLREAGIYCEKIVPDILTLPVGQDSWTAMQLGNTVLLRQGAWQALVGESVWMAPAVENFSKQQEQKVSINFITEPCWHNMANTEIEYQAGELPMQVIAQGAIQSSFNLLQGQYKVKNPKGQKGSQWRIAASLAALAIVLTFTDKAIEAKQLETKQAELRTQVMQEFNRAFPEVTRVRDVKRTMQQRITQLEQGGSGVSMLVMMSQLGAAFQQSQIKPQSIRFDSRRTELRIQAVAGSFDALETFKRLAEQQGFTVEQGAINNRDDQVVGSLAIRS